MDNVPSIELEISTCACDSCAQRGPCALHIVGGRVKYASCSQCHREAWTALGDMARETYVAGGMPRLGRSAN
jgi:hypothetical protein